MLEEELVFVEFLERRLKTFPKLQLAVRGILQSTQVLSRVVCPWSAAAIVLHWLWRAARLSMSAIINRTVRAASSSVQMVAFPSSAFCLLSLCDACAVWYAGEANLQPHHVWWRSRTRFGAEKHGGMHTSVSLFARFLSGTFFSLVLVVFEV